MRRPTLALATTMALISAACVGAASPSSTGALPEAIATGSAASTTPTDTATSFPTPVIAGTPLPTSTSHSTVTTAPNGSLTHVRWEGIGFDVPADWAFRPANIKEHYIYIVGFLGTAPSVAECVPTVGPGTATGTMCHTDMHLTSHTVSVALETHDGPGPLEPMGYTAFEASGATISDVDGVPALLDREQLAGGPATIELTIQAPGSIGEWLTLTATIEGPDAGDLEDDVDAAFGSVRFEPPVGPLPTDNASRQSVVTNAMTSIAGDARSFACFPRKAGRSTTTTVTEYPFQAEYNPPHPHRATCSTTLEAFPIGFWKLTLALQWGKRGDPATTFTVWSWLERDGTPTSVNGTGQYPP